MNKMNSINRFSDVVSYNLKEFIEPIDFSRVNIIKISKANSLEHELKKCEIAVKCVHSGLNILVEPKCLDKKIRPDVLVLDSIPPIAYEIVKSELSSSLSNKENNYP